MTLTKTTQSCTQRPKLHRELSCELSGLAEAQLGMIWLFFLQNMRPRAEVSDKRNFLFLKVVTYSNISTKGIPFQVRGGGEVPDPQNIKVLILAGGREKEG